MSSSSLSLHAVQECGSFWLSVASTLAWPTFLSFLGFLYLHTTITYRWNEGGKVEVSTMLGEVVHHDLEPGTVSDEILDANHTGGCLTSTSSTSSGNNYDISSVGYGSLSLFLNGYPLRNFTWDVNSEEAVFASAQLVRRALVKRPVLDSESVSRSKLAISLFGFAFGLVGLLRDPKSVPLAVKAMFTAGVVPDIRVFLLGSSIASVLGFICGSFAGLVSHAPSVRESVRYVSRILKFLWVLLCMMSFGVGCWQIDVRRKAKQPVWPMFIYWVPASFLMPIVCCGINATAVFGTVGVVLGIIAGNQASC